MVIVAIGLATGLVYALVAAGYSLIYRTTGIVNFAQGTFVMIGGMTAYWFLEKLKLPYVLADLCALVAAGLTGLILWTFVILPLWRRRAVASVVILATLVFSALLEASVLQSIGATPQTLPEWTPGFRIAIGNSGIDGQYVWVALIALAMLAAVAAFLRWSTLGKSMRACAANREASRLLGIDPERVGALAMTATAVVGGIAGIVNAPAQYTSFDAGLSYGIYGFVAAVLGGFGSLWGALIGGVLVGLIQAFVGRYMSATYESFVAFALLLILLAFRPQGILGAQWEGADS